MAGDGLRPGHQLGQLPLLPLVPLDPPLSSVLSKFSWPDPHDAIRHALCPGTASALVQAFGLSETNSTSQLEKVPQPPLVPIAVRVEV